MKKGFFVFCAMAYMVLSTSVVSAVPIDLSSFTADEGVSIAEGTANFTEMTGSSAVYLYNDKFAVRDDATLLTFDYLFTRGENDFDDYFLFEVNFTPELELFESSSGSFSIDLSSYRGQTISLAWGLLWSWDESVLSSATISTIDLATEEVPPAPVPEPATLILLGTGLLGVAGIGRARSGRSARKS